MLGFVSTTNIKVNKCNKRITKNTGLITGTDFGGGTPDAPINSEF
jgi:hypothetical protein